MQKTWSPYSGTDTAQMFNDCVRLPIPYARHPGHQRVFTALATGKKATAVLLGSTLRTLF